jgi:uncharacterized protein (TIGR03435 family)
MAQPQPASPPLAFEAASVRPSGPHVAGRIEGAFQWGPGTADPGRITASRVTLLNVLERAYGVQADQISGPGWLAEEYYDIAAKLAPGATEEQLRLMLQNLLTERFKLALHREKKEFPAWNLVVAKDGSKLKTTGYPDAKLGPGEGVPLIAVPVDQDGFPKIPPAQHGGAARNINGVTHGTYQAFSVSDLVVMLGFTLATRDGNFSPARIMDKTGLTGKYDFHLEYSVDTTGRPADDDLTVGGGPSIFTALEKQLGLKLEKTKESLDVLLIEHVEKVPTQN